MKSLILKDIYSGAYIIKPTLFMAIIFMFATIPSGGIVTYIPALTICVTTNILATIFVADEKVNWIKYVVVMPVSKKEIVKSKFIILFIFTTIGVVVGVLLGIVGVVLCEHLLKEGFIQQNLNTVVLISSVISTVAIGIFTGSTTIYLLFKLGVEKARMLMMSGILIPFFLVYGGVMLMSQE